MKNVLTNEFEKKYWPELVVGIDEAGRGPICGPLVVAACVLPADFFHPDIYDSKKISPKKRELLYQVITEKALWWHVEIVDASVIDSKNIYQATKEAMEKLLFLAPVQIGLIDAMVLNSNKTVHSIIKGDSLSISIASASILAKVTRDRIMIELDRKFPQYCLAQHKGYPTKRHLSLLEKFGPQSFYRFSYGPLQKFRK